MSPFGRSSNCNSQTLASIVPYLLGVRLHSDSGRVGCVDNSRRSRIFLRGRPLSCQVPSRRDSVGGGGNASYFPLMGPFYIFFLSRRGGGAGPLPPLNRPLDNTYCLITSDATRQQTTRSVSVSAPEGVAPWRIFMNESSEIA